MIVALVDFFDTASAAFSVVNRFSKRVDMSEMVTPV